MTGEFYLHLSSGKLIPMPYPDEIKIIKKPDFEVGFDGKCFFYDGAEIVVTLYYYVMNDDEDLDGWDAYRQMKYGDYWVVKGTEIIKEITKKRPELLHPKVKVEEGWISAKPYIYTSWTTTAVPDSWIQVPADSTWLGHSVWRTSEDG